MIIHLGCRLPDTSRDLPGSSGGQPSNTSLFGLAPGGVYPASPITRRTGALLPHPFTLTPYPKVRGGLLSVALAFALPRLHVMEHPALRCSDFPPGCLGNPAIICAPPTVFRLFDRVIPQNEGKENDHFHLDAHPFQPPIQQPVPREGQAEFLL